MTHEFRLADIGEGLEEAEILRWMVEVGDSVDRDDPLVEVMTDKSNAELPAPVAGVVVELGGSVGDVVHVGAILAVIEPHAHGVSCQLDPPSATTGTATESAAATSTIGTTTQDGEAAASSPPQFDPVATPATSRVKASPSTRRAAAERGIDLKNISGTGPGGRILLSDLDSQPGGHAQEAATRNQPAPPVDRVQSTTPAIAPAATPQPPTPAAAPAATAQPGDPGPALGAEPGTTVPLRGMRRAIARNMTRSWSDIPHIHSFEHIDAQPLLDMRQRLRDADRAAYVSVTPAAFFVGAVAAALSAYPAANASIDIEREQITYHRGVNVGIAVASPSGLVVPVLRGADRLDFETLAVASGELVRGARDGSLANEHFQGGTATVTNFGSLGGELATPLIRATEAVIAGFGAVRTRPFVINGEVVARSTMHIVLGADHRLVDGDLATAVLAHIAETLRDPIRLLL